MAGKMTDGTTNLWDQKQIRAYSEGVYARYASALPTNPHTTGTPEALAWTRGSDDAAADTIDPCVATPGGALPV